MKCLRCNDAADVEQNFRRQEVGMCTKVGPNTGSIRIPVVTTFR